MATQNNNVTQFNKKGYFVLKEFFDKTSCNKLISEIKEAKETIKHFDRRGNLRRIEKFHNKGKYLKKLNRKIIVFLNKKLKDKFTIFKDKFNVKPPNGEGFYAHYDGVFSFNTKKKKSLKGWYEYTDKFVTTLIALDRCNSRNGTIELANSDDLTFEKLLKNTKQDGTPILKKAYEKKLSFKKINLNVGDIVIFKHTCPHRSGKNYTNFSRRIIYLTYNQKKDGNFYKKYFLDKKNSTNTQKSLSGKK